MKKIFLLLFLIVLFLPVLQMLFPLVPEPRIMGNQTPATLPHPDLRTLKTFPDAFEQYFGERMGFRPYLIRAGSFLKANVLSLRYLNGIIRGQDGWLYLDEGLGSAIEPRAYTKSQLAELAFKRKYTTDQLQSMGATYVEMMIPDKNSVYPAYLPPGANRDVRTTILSRRGDTRLLELFGKIKDIPLYYKTESHWNKYGSYVAYRDLIERLTVSHPGLTPVKIVDDAITLVPRHAGDLARMLAMEDSYTDQETRFALDPSSVSASTKLGKIIIYYDSFFDTQYDWSPVEYLTYNFREVKLVKNFVPIDPGYIAREKPDVVLFEIVERSMDDRKW